MLETTAVADQDDSWKQPYYTRLAQLNLAPLWERLKGLVPGEPAAKGVPYVWHFTQARQLLHEAAGLISAEDAERRVLVLENPGLRGQSQITDTLYVGLQTILPGEVAPAHRHSQSAFRLVLEGSGAYTVVDGERTTMQPGDFVITPSWTWHDHGSEADAPVIWMDGLNVPLVNFLNAAFREERPELLRQQTTRPEGNAAARYGAGLLPLGLPQATPTTPLLNYPYERTREALERLKRHAEIDPHVGLAMRYVNPTNGDWAIPTLGAAMRLLPQGFQSRPYRSTDGCVFVLMEGSIKATVGAATFALQPKDVFVAPSWTHFCLEAVQESILFSFSDRPAHEKLGLWREERC